MTSCKQNPSHHQELQVWKLPQLMVCSASHCCSVTPEAQKGSGSAPHFPYQIFSIKKNGINQCSQIEASLHLHFFFPLWMGIIALNSSKLGKSLRNLLKANEEQEVKAKGVQQGESPSLASNRNCCSSACTASFAYKQCNAVAPFPPLICCSGFIMINRNTMLAERKRSSRIIGSNHTNTKQALTVIKVLPAPFPVPFQHCTDGCLVQQKRRKQQGVLTAICSQEEGRHRKVEGKHYGLGARTPPWKQILDQRWALQAVAQGLFW